MVERAIAFYKLSKRALEASGTPAATRKSLSGLAEKADALRAEIEKIIANPLANVALALEI